MQDYYGHYGQDSSSDDSSDDGSLPGLYDRMNTHLPRGVTVEGLGRQAHKEATAGEPTRRHEKKFIPDLELNQWYAEFLQRYGHHYGEEPPPSLFGNDDGQFALNTKIMQRFDIDRALYIKVRGSRMLDGEPVYVGKIRGSKGELTNIPLEQAHDIYAWTRGWDVEDEDGDESDDEPPIRYPHTPSAINSNVEYEFWCRENGYGSFGDAFINKNFTLAELNGMSARVDGGGFDSEAIASVVKCGQMCAEIANGDVNFLARMVLARIVLSCTVDKFGAVIVKNQLAGGTKFQAIELDNYHARRDGVPCVEITYATDPRGIDNPKLYLRGETFVVIDVSDDVAVLLEDHILKNVRNEGGNDGGSGLIFHQGYLEPMAIESFCETATRITIPDVNFGVELELSCATGTLIDKLQVTLEEYAKVEFRGNPKSETGSKGSGKDFTKGPGGPGYNYWGAQCKFDNKDEGGGKDFGKGSSKDLGIMGPGCKSRAKRNANRNSKGVVRKGPTKWRLVFDKSIQISVENPMSSKFELVSPVLGGKDGLDTLTRTVDCTTYVAVTRLNRSMGLHVHVEALETNFSLQSMICICQQFVQYEHVIDSFLPTHRRTGSPESNCYFQSNINGDVNQTLLSLSLCNSRNELYDVMNFSVEKRRYYKLNMQNLKTGRQATLEFRQHHSTKDSKEVSAWVRFCILFVVNASKMTLSEEGGDKIKSEEATFDTLFDTVIKCPALREYYQWRTSILKEST